jgi:hypothetical protein
LLEISNSTPEAAENNEEKTLKTAPLYQVGEKQEDKQDKHRVFMDLPLFHRRKTMLVMSESGRLNPASLKQLSLDFGCSQKTLLNDWAEHEKWEPFIWENQQAHEDGKKKLYPLRLAREEAVYLMKTAKSAMVRVAAISRVVETVQAEVELGQSLGLLPRTKMDPAVNVEVNVANQPDKHELLKEYAAVIAEAAVANENLPKVRGEKQVDSSQATSSDGQERTDS